MKNENIFLPLFAISIQKCAVQLNDKLAFFGNFLYGCKKAKRSRKKCYQRKERNVNNLGIGEINNVNFTI